MTEGICGNTVTDRNNAHEVCICVLPADHRSAHRNGTCVWTDYTHWGGFEGDD